MTTAVAEEVVDVVISLEDIREGKRLISDECAIARCLRRAGHSGVRVLGRQVHMDFGIWEGPDEMVRWIEDFDNRRPVTPERFTLRLVQDYRT